MKILKPSEIEILESMVNNRYIMNGVLCDVGKISTNSNCDDIYFIDSIQPEKYSVNIKYVTKTSIGCYTSLFGKVVRIVIQRSSIKPIQP